MRDRTNSSSGKSAFDSAADLLATVSAFPVTFYLAPLLVRASVGAALENAEHELGFGWDGVVTLLWWVICVLITFALCKMVIALSVRIGMAKLASFIFRH